MNLSTGIARRAGRRDTFAERPGPGAVALVLLLAVGAFAAAYAAGRLSHHTEARLPEAAPTSFRVASSHSAIPTRLAAAPPIDLGAVKATPAPRRAVRREAPASSAPSGAGSEGALPTVVPSTPSTAPAAATTPPAPTSQGSAPTGQGSAPTSQGSAPAGRSGGGGSGGAPSHSSSGGGSSGGSFDTSG